jgi:formylglycine-generating enzyme required for sulfatase activity
LKSKLAGKGLIVYPAGPGRSADASRPFTPQRSQRGGSFLCNDAYCSRYRPSARHDDSPDTACHARRLPVRPVKQLRRNSPW